MSDGSAGGARKDFVLDTSTLVYAPECADPKRAPFSNNDIVIPLMALRELDGLKADPRRGANAREVLRLLVETFPSQESMRQGVITAGGGKMRIMGVNGHDFKLPSEYVGTTADDYVLRVAGGLSRNGDGTHVVLVTKDISLRLKALAAGIDADDLRTGKVERPQALAPHISDVTAPECFIDELYQNGTLSVDEALSVPFNIKSNTCCRLSAPEGRKHALGIYRISGTEGFIDVVRKNGDCGKRVVPRNAEQLFAYALSMRPEILTTILVGTAGTGKTLMALKAGVDLLETPGSGIKQIVCFRPMIEIGPQLGYLPGSVGEKFAPWAAAIYTNLDLLFTRRNGENGNGNGSEHKPPEKKHGKQEPAEDKKRSAKPENQREKLGRYLKDEIISIQPVTFIRGTTLPNSFIIVDEAQNLTPHEIKALLTRAGEGSRVVLTGDLTQIDNPHLDAASCGLAKALERMKGHPSFGAIELLKGERSKLATIIADLFADL